MWLPLMCPLLGTWPTAQAGALTGNQTGDPLVLRVELNPLSHTSQSWSPLPNNHVDACVQTQPERAGPTLSSVYVGKAHPLRQWAPISGKRLSLVTSDLSI